MLNEEALLDDEGENQAVVPRLMVFPDRPDCLVLYLPRGMALQMPVLHSPFAKKNVADACAKAGLAVRVSDGTPGKWGAAYKSLHKAEVAERNQRHYLAEATANVKRQGSGILAAALAQERGR